MTILHTLSHANKTRDSDIMEELFWETLKHLHATGPVIRSI
jgi:hypothetical protein